jgi:hypothetical protein
MQRLPVGIQSFDMLRNKNLVYVDKTKHIYDLVSGAKGFYFFLSRPRRFGKSLLISTLKELFLGNKQLFESLWISQSDYDWQPHHVICLDFSTIPSDSVEEFRANLTLVINGVAEVHGVEASASPAPEIAFHDLVARLAKTKNVVLLVDEYDRQLLRHVNNPDLMKEIQAIMSSFYSAVKAMGGKISFLFLTGVTKFSKTSIFSGMNNLIDLTLSPDAADLLGYTEQEIDHYFEPHMHEIAQEQSISVADIKNTMRHWYNGYQFSKLPQTVYNPFSVLMYLLTKDLRNYWFETGTPTFLVNLIKAKQYNIEDLDHAELHVDNLSAFEVDDMRLLPLLLQTGYLTIKGYDPDTRNYQLGYPNEETKASFLFYFIEMITTAQTAQLSNAVSRLTKALNAGDLEQFFETLNIFFASVPYTMQLPQEKYYQSIFYVLMNLIGAYVHAEVVTNDGRIDCTIETSERIYIFEFKLHDSEVVALEQIKEKKYYQKFLHEGKRIMLVGVAFDMQQRNIGSCIAEDHQG